MCRRTYKPHHGLMLPILINLCLQKFSFYSLHKVVLMKIPRQTVLLQSYILKFRIGAVNTGIRLVSKMRRPQLK